MKLTTGGSMSSSAASLSLWSHHTVHSPKVINLNAANHKLSTGFSTLTSIPTLLDVRRRQCRRRQRPQGLKLIAVTRGPIH